jgi:ubiquinone/menaquinone biosynthesis C-methylase UbiE
MFIAKSITLIVSITQHKNRMNQSAAERAADPRLEFFNQLAPRWDAECSNPEDTLHRLASLNGRLALAPGHHLLEIGCGTGQVTGWLADAVAPGRVVAADFAPEMLAEARRRNPNAEFLLLDICADQPPPAAFDVILCFNAFPHFRDKPAALRHIARSLKAGGNLIILHLVGSAQINAFHQSLTGPVSRDLLPAPAAWPNLLATSGLRLVSLVDQSDLFLLTAALA